MGQQQKPSFWLSAESSFRDGTLKNRLSDMYASSPSVVNSRCQDTFLRSSKTNSPISLTNSSLSHSLATIHTCTQLGDFLSLAQLHPEHGKWWWTAALCYDLLRHFTTSSMKLVWISKRFDTIITNPIEHQCFENSVLQNLREKSDLERLKEKKNFLEKHRWTSSFFPGKAVEVVEINLFWK